MYEFNLCGIKIKGVGQQLATQANNLNPLRKTQTHTYENPAKHLPTTHTQTRLAANCPIVQRRRQVSH